MISENNLNFVVWSCMHMRICVHLATPLIVYFPYNIFQKLPQNFTFLIHLKKDMIMSSVGIPNRRWGANRPWCTMPGIFVEYNFLKAHPIPFKMTLVSTLIVGAFGRSGLLNALRMWHVANFMRIAIKSIFAIFLWSLVLTQTHKLASRKNMLKQMLFYEHNSLYNVW